MSKTIPTDVDAQQPGPPGPEIRPPGTFVFFPAFPLLIRELVWKECLPKRIIIPNMSPKYFQSSCMSSAIHSQSQPPLIAQVCHEARQLALRHISKVILGEWKHIRCLLGRFESLLAGSVRRDIALRRTWAQSEVSDCALGDPRSIVWLNPKTDTILLDTRFSNNNNKHQFALDDTGKQLISNSARFIFSDHTPSCNDEWHGGPDWDENQWIQSLKTNLFGGPSSPCDLAQTINAEALSAQSIGTQTIGARESIFYYMIVDPVPIHLSPSAAAKTNLFGHFGENKLLMVKLDDRNTFAAICKLPYAEAFPPTLTHALAFGVDKGQPFYGASRQNIISNFKRAAQNHWLGRQLQKEGHRAEDNCDWHHWHSNKHFQDTHPLHMLNMEYDEEHPQIKGWLAGMPNIKPVIVYVLCHNERCLHKEAEAICKA